MTGEWWIGRIFEAIHLGLRNVRCRNLRSGTEENDEEVSPSIARVSALIRIGYIRGTGFHHYLLGEKFRNINLCGIERIPVPMRYPKSQITPSKNAQGLTPNLSTAFDACYFIKSETFVCIVVYHCDVPWPASRVATLVSLSERKPSSCSRGRKADVELLSKCGRWRTIPTPSPCLLHHQKSDTLKL
jgi:hypothetical protein